MTDVTYTWIADVDGNKASVAPDAVDTWKPHGWVETTTPESTDMVWLQHEVTGGKQLFAQTAAPIWEALGWKPSAPPEPLDLTKDHNLVDVQPVVLVDSVSPKKAASGSKKEQ